MPEHTATPGRLLEEWLRFIQSNSHVLMRRPPLLFQQAASGLGDTAPAEAAQRRFADGLEQRPWFRRLNKPPRRSSCLLTLADDGEEVRFATFLPDNRHVVSVGGNGRLWLWNAAKSLPWPRRPGHRRGVFT